MATLKTLARTSIILCAVFGLVGTTEAKPPGGQNCQVGDALTGCSITGPEEDYVCVGVSAFTISPSVDYDYCGDGVGRVLDTVTTTVTWGDGATDTYSSCGATTIPASHTYATGGTKTVGITCADVGTPAKDTGPGGEGTQTAFCTVNVCPPITDIQYQNPCTQEWASANGVSVLSGTTLNLRVIPAEAYPASKPTWGGTAGVTGSGTTKTFTVSGSGQQSVEATCCDTKTVNLCVYNMATYVLPEDVFTGRSGVRYGVGETVNLSYSSDQPGCVDPAQWVWWNEGTGTTSGTTYTVGLPGAVTIHLTCTDGPSCGWHFDWPATVVAPSAASYEAQIPGTGIWHTLGLCSVGFEGWIYLAPYDVSFWKAGFRENECKATGTYFFLDWVDKLHPASAWSQISRGNASTGCRVLWLDQVITQKVPPFNSQGGYFNWAIPWEYTLDGTTAHDICTVNHHVETDANGIATLTKAGAGPFIRLATDQTHGFEP